MWQFILTSWRIGLRGRSIQALLVLGALLIGLAWLAASFSPRQPQTVALDVGFSVLRVALVLLGLFLVQELLTREIERKTVIFAVSYPVGRASYILGRYFGILGLLLLAALGLGLLLWLMVLLLAQGYEQTFPPLLGVPFWAAILGVVLDVAVVSGFAMLLATLSRTALLPLVLGLCFAVAAKTMGVARDYVLSGADGDDHLVAQMQSWMMFVQWLLPDLSRLDWRSWPMYGLVPEWSGVGWGLVASGSYLGLALLIAVLVFEWRDFA